MLGKINPGCQKKALEVAVFFYLKKIKLQIFKNYKNA